jgi:predicted DNA-binding transcriptional regulator AlpA
MPQPKECRSDRLILYDREEVRQAIERRKAARRRVAPLRRGE